METINVPWAYRENIISKIIEEFEECEDEDEEPLLILDA